MITDGIGAKTMPRPSDDEFVSTLRGDARANVRLKVGALDRGESRASSRRRRDGGATTAPRHAIAVWRRTRGSTRFARRAKSWRRTTRRTIPASAASKTLVDLQIKRVRPTPGYRGTLSFGFNAFVNVGLYKLNTEARR